MQKKILFILFGVLLIFTFSLLFYLINSSDVKSEIVYKKDEPSTSKKNSIAFDQNKWIDKLSTYKKSDYLFPVNELFLSIKFNKKKVIKKKREVSYYSLIIPDMSNYSLFCVLQILNKNQVPYMIENDYETSKIFVRSDKKKRVEEISNELKKYNIFPKIKLIKE